MVVVYHSRNTEIMRIVSKHNNHVLEHDEESHTYLLDGSPLVGVTSAISQGYPKAQNLVDWQARKAAQFVYDYDEFLPYPDVVKEAVTSYKDELEEAGDIGTAVHNYCYLFEKGIKFSLNPNFGNYDVIKKCCEQFDQWRAGLPDEIITLEELVCSPSLKYAGRFDRLANRDGVIVLSDYKTSSSFYITQFVQLAGYCMAIEEWIGIHVDDIEIIRFDKKTGKLSTRNLEQVANTFKVKPETMMKKLKSQFETCLETYKFKQKYDKYIRR